MLEEDRALADRAQEGDRAAMELLFQKYRSMVFAVGLSVCGTENDANDIVQETFLRAFRRLEGWRRESKLSTWLYAIGSRVAIDSKRLSSRRPLQRTSPEAALEADRQEERERLLAAIQTLPLTQRLVLTLRHYRALSIAEIAEAQGCSEGAVKANLHFAVAKLRELLLREPTEP